MDYDTFEGPDGVGVRIPQSQIYRTCSECGGDCSPDPSAGGDDLGARIALVCAEHGVQSIIDRFEELR